LSGYFRRGEAIGHAGEILQGGVRLNGGVEPFLVTLPVPAFRSAVTVRSASEWRVTPGWKTKALRAAQLAWTGSGALDVLVESEIPVGRGCGSSTADCVAAVRAVARLNAEEIAAVVQRAELASDATMFDLEPVAFLPRAGTLLQRFDGAWPEMKVDVIDMGGPAVDTLDCQVPPYSADELDEFADLLTELQAAVISGDTASVGRVALRSGAIHQRYRPHAEWETVTARALSAGAVGVALAHSGTVAAVLSMKGGS
jgi:uncharacterized protein involved in propanediol utilization